ncbi:fibronectin type III domain-containing protein, partial [Oleiphilus sp. HI0128]
LSVGATGGELSYQWRRDGVELQGAVLSSLLISAADTSDSGSYDVLVSDESGTLESLTALVVVNELPPVVVIDPVQISTQPTSVSVDEGEGAVLSVAASGGGELVYQWFKGGVAISGATSSSLSFASASVSDSGVYSVSVTNSVGSQTSVNATIQVNEVISIAPVVIASQPQSTAIDEGETAVLSIVATGGGDLSYTWRKDGVQISGANASSLSIEAASVADAGAYDVIVSNSVGQQVSSVANVEINELEVLQSIALEWSIPEERADGTALDLNEIDSYLIRYGTDASNLAQSVVVGSGSDTSAQIDDMVAGTYYFVILTIDIDGVQSEESEIISLTI